MKISNPRIVPAGTTVTVSPATTRRGGAGSIWTPEDVEAAHAAFMQLWERLPEEEKIWNSHETVKPSK